MTLSHRRPRTSRAPKIHPGAPRSPWPGPAALFVLGLLAGPSLAQTAETTLDIPEESRAVSVGETIEHPTGGEAHGLEARSLARELTQLSKRLDDRLRRVASLRSADAVPGMIEESQQIERLLGFLRTRAAALEPATARRLTAKIVALGRQLDNLRLALDGSPSPPWISAAPGASGAVLGRPTEDGGTPANDVCADAPTIAAGSFAGTTLGATRDGQASCGASLASSDVWYEIVMPSSGTVWIDSLGSAFDTVLSVHQGCPGTLANELTCDDDTLGLSSAVGFFASAGQSYWLRVSGYDGATGPLALNVGTGGVVRGTVVDSVSTTPITSGGEVCLYTSQGFFAGCSFLQADGTYLVSQNGPGSYFVRAESSGFVAELFDDVRCPDGFGSPGCEPSDGTAVTVGAIDDATVDFALDPAGTIQGIVLDEDDDQPIAFAAVRSWNPVTQEQTLDIADASGVYRLTGLESGNYRVFTATDSHQDEIWDDVPCLSFLFGPGCDPNEGSPVVVTEGVTTTGIDFRLRRGGEIQGQVTDARDGTPLSSVDISLFHQETEATHFASTDGSGNFSHSGLPEGTYFARAARFGYSRQLFDGLPCDFCDLTDGTPFAVALDTTVTGIDFELEPLGNLEGQVRRASDGGPVGSGFVELYDDEGYVTNDFFFGDGHYSLSELDAGTYFAVATSTTFEDELHFDIPCEGGCDPSTGTPIVVAGAATTLVDFAVDTGGIFSGTVTDAETGLAAPGVTIGFWNESGVLVRSTSTASDGSFSSEPLDPGTYFVTARAAGRFENQIYSGLDCIGTIPTDCDPTLGTPVVSVINGLTSGIDFSLSPGAGLSGTVTCAADGSAIDSLGVFAWDASDQLAGSDVTNSSGQYSIRGLAPGTYKISTAASSDHLAQMYDGINCVAGCDLSLATPRILPADTTLSGLDFALPQKASIVGTVVREADGMPVTDTELTAYRVSNLTFAGTGYTNSDGTYEIEGLLPGSYFVLANSFALADEVWDDLPCNSVFSCDLDAATPVEVPVGADAEGIDFALIGLGSLSGLVRDDSGLPIAGVEVVSWYGGEFSDRAYSDATGFYRIDRLRAGDYYLTTSNSWGYLDESYDDIPCLEGAFAGCDPFKGTVVSVQSDLETRHIDFELQFFSRGILGTVLDESGEPVPGAVVDLWSELGGLVASVPTRLNGTYLFAVPEGTYFVSTDNGQGLIDEVFDDLSCPGSAYAGGCDPTTGTPVVVGETGSGTAVASGIDFELRAPEPAFFADGFESGDLSAWSSAVGSLP